MDRLGPRGQQHDHGVGIEQVEHGDGGQEWGIGACGGEKVLPAFPAAGQQVLTVFTVGDHTVDVDDDAAARIAFVVVPSPPGHTAVF